MKVLGILLCIFYLVESRLDIPVHLSSFGAPHHRQHSFKNGSRTKPGLLSHVRHSLPGRSSVSITRGWNMGGAPLPSIPQTQRDPISNYLEEQTLAAPQRQKMTHASRTPTVHSGEVLIKRHKENIPPSSRVFISDPVEETPGPFSPRFKVGKWEVGDEEWREEIKQGLEVSGLVPDFLPYFPAGLVNINFGVHACVHLGTHLTAQTTSLQPSRLSYPADKHRLYTVLLLDAEVKSLHWMVINVPGTALRDGQVIAEYQPPAPSHSRPHRFLALALLQEGVVNKSSLSQYSAYLCEEKPRTGFSIRSFLEEYSMEIAAANYFMIGHDAFVDTIVSFCRERRNTNIKYP